ncbi:HTH domain-containing protein [Bythopirellula goksoeyrii]|uniref:HTH HARE-type domain-containing protein n=1 Tax=Bythopirellula goksoeyrii TaxID=1400387 RepID=A0A5B9QBC1_9BACT|nr:HTH domain-containing protein [Bythopirellula goksoeyrii]QEG34860.1 hypothetical protein Pr1d_21480 [Bythopirellula goksoeyrii]
MGDLKQLIKAARSRRNATIQQAREHYAQTVRALQKAARKTSTRRKRHYRPNPDQGGDFSKLNTREAAESVLRELGPLTLVEITVEVMRRGCRSGENPRVVANAIFCALRYHEERGRFSRDGEGRWSIQ